MPKNFRLRSLAMMWEVGFPTVPSSAALSRGAKTRDKAEVQSGNGQSVPDTNGKQLGPHTFYC